MIALRELPCHLFHLESISVVIACVPPLQNHRLCLYFSESGFEHCVVLLALPHHTILLALDFFPLLLLFVVVDIYLLHTLTVMLDVILLPLEVDRGRHEECSVFVTKLNWIVCFEDIFDYIIQF